jgi:hypothetical protein
MLDRVTKDTFDAIKGGVFDLALNEKQIIPLELVAVLGNGLQGLANREQFALHFRGPLQPALPQRIYPLTHSSLGTLEIFLVPIKRDADGMIYEAVFT